MRRTHSSRAAVVRRIAAVAVYAIAAFTSATTGAQRRDSARDMQNGASEARHLDARVDLSAGMLALPEAQQRWAVEALRAELPELDALFDETTGVTRGLWNRVGYLTAPDSRPALDIARAYIAENLTGLGLRESDVADLELTDSVFSKPTGATHIYFRQRVKGLAVYNAQLHININRDGRIISVNNSFLPEAEAAVNALQPSLDAPGAVVRAAAHLNIPNAQIGVLAREAAGTQRETVLHADRVSTEPITARLMLLPIRRGEARLVWNFAVILPDEQHAYDFTIDAASGKVWTRFDWVSSDQYKVFAMPTESPSHASPPTPADGRTTVANPAHATGSPFGWHDTNGVSGAEYTIMRGNNVHAYEDSAGTNAPPATEPNCSGSLDCSFTMNLADAPATYRAAATANLFYWNNIIHDVQYVYGFDEAAGNFQVNNYGNGGIANDDVRAEAQDGGGMNNANMFTPPDGQRPRMQMYLWTTTSPQRDGDFDNGIIVHEYGHGISIRQVGGPSNTNCLTNVQQAGEGISDWLALVYTARAGDGPTTRRGIGTYALGQATTGNGIRGLPYTTDTSVNDWTYASIGNSSFSVPHGIGSVWAQGMWRVYWALVSRHGFSTNLYAPNGGAGNQRAMLYHNEGLKNAACNPTFTQLRDAIIQAAVDNYGGEDVCRLWDAFAAFGLGSDAISGGSSSRTPYNGFNTPVACGGTAVPSLSVGDASVVEGNSGTTTASLTASLTSAYPWDVRVQYVTADGTAIGSTAHNSSSGITVPSSGSGSPYPATVVISGFSGTIQQLRVRLNSVTHTWPNDLDVLLVGPGGETVLLMSDVGGTGPGMNNVNLTFQDGAVPMPDANVPSGTFAPTNIGTTDPMASPAPAGPYGSSLAAFNGLSPNGTWSLYVVDDTNVDSGSIASFSLMITTSAQDYMPKAGEIVIPAGSTTQTITVDVNGDTAVESNETINVNLVNALPGVTLADSLGVLTIVDDDSGGGSNSSNERMVIGLGPYSEGGWMNVRKGSAASFGLGSPSWTRLPWAAYNASGKGVRVAAGNVDGDSRDELIVGLNSGGAGWIAVLDDAAANHALIRWIQVPWAAYNAANGEVWPAAGDLTGDGIAEIVAGLGTGGQGWFAIFNANGSLIGWRQTAWGAYNAGSDGSTRPAIANLDGAGASEVVLGLGRGGGGWVEIFTGASGSYTHSAWLQLPWGGYNAANGETHVAAGDINGDGRAEIVAGLGPGGGGWLHVWSGASGFPSLGWRRTSWAAYNSDAARGAVFPAVGNIDDDAQAEIVLGLGPFPGAGLWMELLDHGGSSNPSLGWRQVPWAAAVTAGTATSAAIGVFR